MASPSIAVGLARALLDLAASRGANRQALLERSGIGPEQLQDPDNRIAFVNYEALMRAGQELSGDPALALHFGEAFDMTEMSIVGLLCMTSETAVEAFEQMNRYERLIVDVDGLTTGGRLVLEHGADQAWLVDTRKNPNDFPELTESTFARMVCMSRRTPGAPQPIKAVYVTHAAPAYCDEYDRIFQMPVIFNSDRNALLMVGGSWLTERTVQSQSSRYVFGVLSERAQALLGRLESSTSTRGRIESLLIPILHTGDVSIERIAGILGLSRQTVFRQLKAEGTTFRETLDELRHKMARHYLGGNKVSVNQTAYLVGFSDPAAFSRAFKRWTGSSPRALRLNDSNGRSELNQSTTPGTSE